MIIHDNKEIIPIKVNDRKDVVQIKDRSVATIEVYHGTYEITPNAHAQIELNTEGKKLERNVVVDTIPYYETHNENGITVYIGE